MGSDQEQLNLESQSFQISNVIVLPCGLITGVGNLRLLLAKIFLGIVFGITEVFGPDDSFAAPAGFRIVANANGL